MFCENCDSVLVPLKEEGAAGALVCRDCGWKSTDEETLEEFVIKDTVDESERSRIEVIERDTEYGGVPEEYKEELRELQKESLEYFDL